MENKNWRTPNPMPAEAEIIRTLSADLVIIGGGQAGTCAARAATEAGATVIVAEQKPENRMSYNGGGQIGQINSEFAKSRGIPEVDIVDFINDWQLRANNRANPGLIAAFARSSGACTDWILSRLTQEQRDSIQIRQITPDGKLLKPMEDNSGIKTWIGCINVMRGNQLIAMNALRHESEENGAEWLYGTSGWCLITGNGAVTGAIVKDSEGHFIRCLAKKGVLLATGDFGGDKEMIRDLCTEPFDTVPDLDLFVLARSDGMGHKMGYWAGGKMEPRPLSTMGGNYSYPGGSPMDPIGTTAALWLNARGRRYCNEGFGDVVLAAVHGLRQPKGRLSVVFDSKIEQQVLVQTPGHLSFDYADEAEFAKLRRSMAQAMGAADDSHEDDLPDIPGGPAKVVLVGSDTLEGLADKLGYAGADKERFLQSVARYNEKCYAKRDDDFGKDARLLFPIDTPPYYGYQSENRPSNCLCTTGGLLTDENQNVLDADNNPIPGLFATGNVCGGRFGAQYTTPVSGVSIGMAQTMGRVAGQYIASL